MDIVIKTRFNVGDEAYVFDNGLKKVVVRDILITNYSYMYCSGLEYKVMYLCEHKDTKQNERYGEDNLYQSADLRVIIKSVLGE